MTEEQLHKQICTYIKMQYPKVLFNTDMSGIKLTMGQAKKMKSLRSSRAFPDITIYHPNSLYHGLFLEVKKDNPYKQNGELKKDKHLEEQNNMLNKLYSLGYMVCFIWTFEDAKRVIDHHMNMN